MHLFTEYALSTGSKIKTPKLLEKFFPISAAKYITCQVKSAMPGKDYDYFQEVIDLIKPILDKNNIQIIQLGIKDEPSLQNVINLCGQTNLAQSTYIIHRSFLHFGIDSALVHIASVLDKPIVATYAISPPEVCGPYFNKNSRALCLTPEFPEGYKYSYNPNEQPKMVNSIKPEKIAAAILDLLSLNEDLRCDSIYFGKDYKKTLIEIVPDHILDPRNFPNALLHVRNDLFVNPDGVFGNLFHKKCIVVTDTPLDTNILKNLKHNLVNILYLLRIENKERDLSYIKQLHESGLPYVLLTSNKENLAQFKFDYLDFNPVILFPINKKEDIKGHENISTSTYFKTNKLLLSNGKIYMSRGHWRAGMEYNPNEKNKVLENEEFWHDLDYCYYFNLKDI